MAETPEFLNSLGPEYRFNYSIDYTMVEEGAQLPSYYPTQLSFTMLFPGKWVTDGISVFFLNNYEFKRICS